jgi:hypothetical protein
MERTRRILLMAVAAFNGAVLVMPRAVSQERYAIPVEPPAGDTPPLHIKAAGELILAALRNNSEDKPMTIAAIVRSQPDLAKVSPEDIDLSIRQLLWERKIEEVDNAEFALRVVRSGGG